MKILFVYSNTTCACTKKYTFELSEAMKKYVTTNIIFYKDITDELVKLYDVVILQRLGTINIINADEVNNIFKIMDNNRKNTKFIYIMDDLVLESQNSLPIAFIRQCDAVFCTSRTLAKYINIYNKNVHFFHTFIDVELLDKIPASKYDKFTIVWASTGGLGSNIIKEIVNKRKDLGIDFNLITIGGSYGEFKDIEGVKAYPIIPEEEMISVMKGAQLLLNPLIISEKNRISLQSRCYAPMNDFVNSKTEIKYAIAGITKSCLLTTPIERCLVAIEDNINGVLLDDSPEKWINKIKYLYKNQNKIQQISNNAYNHVKIEYSKYKAARDILYILQKII